MTAFHECALTEVLPEATVRQLAQFLAEKRTGQFTLHIKRGVPVVAETVTKDTQDVVFDK